MLPVALPPAASLYVADYDVFSVATQPAAGGTATVTSNVVDQGKDYAWLIDNVVIQNTSSTESRLLMFIGSPGDTTPATLAAGSDSGNLDFDDVAGGGLLVRASEAITFQWTGCSDGAVGTARVQYRKLRQGGQ